jgi:DNA-cytosine methyltransferase
MKVLSLFDGISVAQQALKELGVKGLTYYASEIDKYAIGITMKNHPNTIQVGDVKKVSGGIRDVREQIIILNDIDLLIGGSPCQDLSIAKKNREGLSGSRSGLFWEYVRILKEIKPKYFVLENVNSMPKEAKQIITEVLGVEPIMINAALVSAQNRKRLFWTNIPNIGLPEDRGILLRDILQPNTEVDERMVINGKSFSLTASYNGAVEWNSVERKQRTMVRVGQIGKGGQSDRIYSPNGKSVNLSANGGGRGAKTGLYAITQNGYETNDSVPEIGQANRVYNHNGKIIPLNTWSPKIRQDEIVRKLSPIECERLQSLPDNYTEGVSNTQRYKALGNAFNCEVVKHILKNIIQ